jgi:hypothetical protein
VSKTNKLDLNIPDVYDFMTEGISGLANNFQKIDQYAMQTDESIFDLQTKAGVYARNMKFITAEIDILKATGQAQITAYTGDQLTAANLDAGSLAEGNNYYVYELDGGGFSISLNAVAPQGYTVDSAHKIGGFHYGKCRGVSNALQPTNTAGAVRGSGWEANIFSGIVPRSVWTLTHRPKCSPEGMVYLASGAWIDIYIAADDGAGGVKSIKGAIPLVNTTWYDFVERMLAVGKRLPSYAEWLEAAVGSPGGNDSDNTNAWTKTTNTAANPTGSVDRAVSSVGCRDCVGNVWEWIDELITRAEHATGGEHASLGWGWDSPSPLGTGYGNIHQYYRYSLAALIAGGNWYNGVNAGARAVSSSNCPWYSNANLGARGACDSL